MTLDELRAALAEVDTELRATHDEYRDADLPEDEQAHWDDLVEKRDGLTAEISRIEKRQARVKDLGDAGTTDAPSVRTSKVSYDVEEIRKDSYSPEDFVRKVTDNARRVIDDVRVPLGASKAETQERMSSLLDNVDDAHGTLAKRFTAASSDLYERAWGKAVRAQGTAGLTMEEQRALALGVDTDGGYAVPVQLDPTVIHTQVQHINPVRGVARVVQIAGKEWQGIVSDGITVTRYAEPTTAAAPGVNPTSPTFTQPTVRTNRVSGFVPFSFEIDADWGALRSEISSMLGEAKDLEEAVAFTTGSGVGLNPQGVVTGLAGGQEIPAGAGTLANPFTAGAANLYALEEALPVRYRSAAVFMGSKPVYNKVRQIDTAGGAALWERIGANTPSQLLGYSLYENSVMSGLPATNGTRVLLFGDFSKYIIVDRVGMSVELVPHVFGTPASGGAPGQVTPTGQRGILAFWRNNAKVLIPDAFRALKVAT